MRLRIGLEGAEINNENLGCVALTYSLLTMLEKISGETGIYFEYYVFENSNNIDRTSILCSKLEISRTKIHAI